MFAYGTDVRSKTLLNAPRPPRLKGAAGVRERPPEAGVTT